ncbi:hypothetical protein F3J37_01695 [Pantoea sp. Al-1710]|uniref:Uncharacterized protein n=1 Tax=Candidatus Pantoea communis TaxID=2608354 RepID=A0ABX0RIB6_9GAMM|nr:MULTISPECIES: hypothetical protein [Pantoea]NIG12907.1 hypothetical protein [Pantoea sp. Cy-640]NIG17392.1 hypothetical protein [Pantoea communis]
MNKTEFFDSMKECRVNLTAFITISPRDNGKTALVMNQSGAPNAFLSMHKDGSQSLRQAWDKYERWLKEFFMNFDDIINEDHVAAIEEDREIQALLAESDEVSMMEEEQKKEVIELTHEAALVMNEEIDRLSQDLADRRCYFYDDIQIHNGQQAVIARYKKEAFDNGPRLIQHILKVIVISRRRAEKLTGYAETPPPPRTSDDIFEYDIPF